MKIEDRFMSKVLQKDDGCWIWTAAIVKAVGYGRFGMGGDEVDYAHRASWRIFCGPIPAGMFVCHRCDVRACVNPEHLFLGSPKANMRDAANKGRIRIPARSFASDETHQVAKLTDAQVQEIRRSTFRYGDTKRAAARFGVTPGAIWLARTGRTFKDVPCN